MVPASPELKQPQRLSRNGRVLARWLQILPAELFRWSTESEIDERSIQVRGQALEDSFFRSVDQALVEIMREDAASDESRLRLCESTGIKNEEILDELMDAGVTQSTLIAFLLLPLAEVAWADGKVDEEEQSVVINTAVALGYSEESVGIRLLRSWLAIRPDDHLFSIWQDYASQLSGHLKQSSHENLSRTIVARAKAVANATGGLLGVHKTSGAERTVIDQIKSALID